MRFPAYFTLNLALERRFTFLGYKLALRAGFDDITNRHNPAFVDTVWTHPASSLTGVCRLAP
jgi:hypothetical protein